MTMINYNCNGGEFSSSEVGKKKEKEATFNVFSPFLASA
jgi:hypothetical protein